jgi:hypothetical protein
MLSYFMGMKFDFLVNAEGPDGIAWKSKGIPSP